jgi:hypothetical protein
MFITTDLLYLSLGLLFFVVSFFIVWIFDLL